MEEQVKRTRKKITTDEKIKALQSKIDQYQSKIDALTEKIEELKAPKLKFRDVSARIKELDLSLDEVMRAVEKLGKK